MFKLERWETTPQECRTCILEEAAVSILEHTSFSASDVKGCSGILGRSLEGRGMMCRAPPLNHTRSATTSGFSHLCIQTTCLKSSGKLEVYSTSDPLLSCHGQWDFEPRAPCFWMKMHAWGQRINLKVWELPFWQWLEIQHLGAGDRFF